MYNYISNIGKRYVRTAVLLLAFLSVEMAANAQLAIKTNILYDATTTPNLGLEYGLGPKNGSADFPGGQGRMSRV